MSKQSLTLEIITISVKVYQTLIPHLVMSNRSYLSLYIRIPKWMVSHFRRRYRNHRVGTQPVGSWTTRRVGETGIFRFCHVATGTHLDPFWFCRGATESDPILSRYDQVLPGILCGCQTYLMTGFGA